MKVLGTTADMSDVDDLAKDLEKVQQGLQAFAKAFLQKASPIIGVQAVRNHMRDAGKGAGRRSPSDTGPLRIVTGRLSRSLRGSRTGTGEVEAIDRIDIVGEIVRLIKGSRVPYAAAHEYGSNRSVSVPSHRREINRAFTAKVDGPREVVTVRAHTRKMSLAKRAYLEPALQEKLPELTRMANRDLATFITQAIA